MGTFSGQRLVKFKWLWVITSSIQPRKHYPLTLSAFARFAFILTSNLLPKPIGKLFLCYHLDLNRVFGVNVHWYYFFVQQRFDVAVLRLDRPVHYMPHISPICLPDRNEDFLGQYGWAAGWGALQAGKWEKILLFRFFFQQHPIFFKINNFQHWKKKNKYLKIIDVFVTFQRFEAEAKNFASRWRTGDRQQSLRKVASIQWH